MISAEASRALDHDTSGRFDIADRLGVKLLQLEKLCDEGNGYAAWLAYRLCRADERALPDWILSYFDQTGAFLLDEYHRADTEGRNLEAALKVNAVKSQRDGVLGGGRWRSFVEAMLPRLVDDYAAQHGLPTQAAIKQLAPTLGYPGEQWTRLRDAYKRAKQQPQSQAKPRP